MLCIMQLTPQLAAEAAGEGGCWLINYLCWVKKAAAMMVGMAAAAALD